MKVRAGDKLTFKGCMWNDGWEFDAPIIIYSPVKVFESGGSIGCLGIETAIEGVCIDLSVGLDVSTEWSETCKAEFKNRGWSENGFSRRRTAFHVEVEIEFYNDIEAGGLMWRVLSTKHKEPKHVYHA